MEQLKELNNSNTLERTNGVQNNLFEEKRMLRNRGQNHQSAVGSTGRNFQ